MKFDIIEALDKVQAELPYDSTINCSKSEDGYLVQIKVIVPNLYGQNRTHSEVYGQQFVFTKAEVLNDEWYIMNDKFDMAIASLKRQIEEG